MRAMLLHPLSFWRDHRFAIAHASAFVDGELPESDARRVAQHSHVCPRCHEMLKSLRAVIRGLDAIRRTPDETVVDDVLDALRRSGDH